MLCTWYTSIEARKLLSCWTLLQPFCFLWYMLHFLDRFTLGTSSFQFQCFLLLRDLFAGCWNSNLFSRIQITFCRVYIQVSDDLKIGNQQMPQRNGWFPIHEFCLPRPRSASSEKWNKQWRSQHPHGCNAVSADDCCLEQNSIQPPWINESIFFLGSNLSNTFWIVLTLTESFSIFFCDGGGGHHHNHWNF